MFIAVMRVSANRVTKYAEFNTRKEAGAHLAAHTAWPDAFIVDASKIAGPVPHWWIEGQTITIVVPPDPEGERFAVDEAAHAAVKADAFVRQFIAMTPAQVSAYIGTNVTSLATAKPVIDKLALMVLLLARREFRG